MSFTSLINLRHCKVTRKTDVLLVKRKIVPNPVVDYQPPAGQPGCVDIYISDSTPGTWSVTVTGTDASGGGISETLTFMGNGAETGDEEFQTITSVTTFDLLPLETVVGDMEIRLVTPSGQPIYHEITIFKEMKCWCDLHHGGVIVQIPGGVITSVTKLFTKYDPLVRIEENDIISFRDRKYRVDYIEETFTKSKIAPHHLELILKQAKTNED